MSHIAPSILAADFTRLGKDVEAVRDAGAKYLHLDVMDGHFVPNISFGSEIVHQLRPLCGDMLFDVHLMLTDPMDFIRSFAEAGADMITVHAECDSDTERCVELITSLGVRPGVAVKPATAPEKIFRLLDRLSLVLVMTVEPGFGAQAMIPQCLDKIPVIKREARERGNEGLLVSVDGGVNAKNCRRVAETGADILVAGSAVFGRDDVGAKFAGLESKVACRTAACP